MAGGTLRPRNPTPISQATACHGNVTNRHWNAGAQTMFISVGVHPRHLICCRRRAIKLPESLHIILLLHINSLILHACEITRWKLYIDAICSNLFTQLCIHPQSS